MGWGPQGVGGRGWGGGVGGLLQGVLSWLELVHPASSGGLYKGVPGHAAPAPAVQRPARSPTHPPTACVACPAGLGPALFLPWAAWTCVWTAAFILLLSAAGACAYISRFTRFAGELFGGLIAVGGCAKARLPAVRRAWKR